MKKYIFLSFVATICFSSCTTYQYTSRQANIERKNIVASSTIVDVKADYGKRVEATSTRQKDLENAKREAQYLAITQNKIDVVVDPIYKIAERSGKFQVTLTGFAGYYTNSRTFYEDLQLLHEIDREDIEKYLLLHNPEILKYLDEKNHHSEVININHYEDGIKK